jgi:thiamine kinase-like enzyme
MTPETVLAGLPGWENAEWRPLDGGITNHVWLVETDGRKAVLKIDESPRGSPFNSREAEAKIQSIAAESGLANRVLHVADNVLMTEYLAGEVLAPSDLRNEETLTNVALALRRVHGLPLTGRQFDAPGAARLYAGHVSDEYQETVQQHLQVIESMPEPSRLACCHNDLVAENIIATPEIHFLDWEYACDNDPMFDIATIVAHHELSDELALVLLNTYFDGDGDRWRKPLESYKKVYAALLWLWNASQ